MKRVISLFICVVMCMTMFSATAQQVCAIGVATELVTVTSGEFADDTITFTLNLAANNTKVTGAIVKAYFDSTVLEVVDAGAVGTTDDAGDFVQSVPGIYETGLEYNNDGVYAVGYMNATGYTVGDTDKAFATITFRAISADRAMATVDFKCIEYVTDDSNADNDIKKTDGAQDVASHTFHTLSMPKVTEVNSIDGGLRVVWSESVGATSYELYRKTADSDVWTLLSADIGVATEYIDTDTVMGTEYYYTVSASNDYGSTEYDETGLAGMNFGTIVSINAVAVETGARITWSSLDGAKSYEVYRKLAASENWQLVNTVAGCEYKDETLSSGVEYNYKVKAINGKYSADMSCQPATVKYIAVPFSTVSNISDGIEIYFDPDVGGAEKYVIEKKVPGGDYSVIAEISAGDADTYVDEDVVVDGQYIYTIQAIASDISSAKKEFPVITRLGTPVMGEIENVSDGVSFNWSAVSGATGYLVYRKTADESSWINCATTEDLSYVDKNVLSGVKYTYAVSAQNETGCGASAQNALEVTYVKAPSGISAAAIADGIRVDWSTVNGAESYKVYRVEAGKTNWAVIGTTTENSFVDKNADFGVYYKYTVSAVADSCESVYNTTGVEGMYFGTIKSISASAIKNGAVITWEALEKADSYEVYRKTADDTSWKKLAKVASNQYTDTSMASGVVYEYKVKAYNGNNVSDMTADPAQIKILKVPTGIAKNVNNGIQITVTPVNGAEGYVIEKKIGGVFTVIATLDSDVTAYVDTDVEADKEYSYRVYATSSDTESFVYEIGTVLRLSCPKITKISNVVPGISLTWTAIDDAVGYEVLRKDEYNDEWELKATISETSYIDADVFSDEYYSYTINALMSDGGKTGYDDTGKTHLFLETPDLVSVTEVSGGVQFKWSPVDGATGYIVYRKTSGTSWEVLGTVTGTSYTDKNVTSGKWTYTVKATDGEYQSYFDSGISINYVGVSKPATPKLSKIANTASGVKVTWGAVKGAEKYIVYRKTYDAKTKKWSGWVNIAKNVTTNSYVDKTAKSGTYYLYTVRANNAAGTSGYNSSGIKTYFLSIPTVKTANANSGVTVKWSKSAGATGYIVYRKTTEGWTKIATVKGASTVSYTDKTAKAGITYKYTVKAYYGSYASAYNTSGVEIRRLTMPTLKSAVSSKSGITLKWTKVAGASGYIVYRKTTGGWAKVATVKGNSKITYLDKSAKKGVTYKYTVRAYYGKSTSAYNTKGISCKDKY